MDAHDAPAQSPHQEFLSCSSCVSMLTRLAQISQARKTPRSSPLICQFHANLHKTQFVPEHSYHPKRIIHQMTNKGRDVPSPGPLDVQNNKGGTSCPSH